MNERIAPASIHHDYSNYRESMSAVNEHRQAPYADKFFNAFRYAFQTDPFFIGNTAYKTFC